MLLLWLLLESFHALCRAQQKYKNNNNKIKITHEKMIPNKNQLEKVKDNDL